MNHLNVILVTEKISFPSAASTYSIKFTRKFNLTHLRGPTAHNHHHIVTFFQKSIHLNDNNHTTTIQFQPYTFELGYFHRRKP